MVPVDEGASGGTLAGEDHHGATDGHAGSMAGSRVGRASSRVDPPRTVPPPPRIVTAASLFDGHDAAINVMRRLIQAAGAEVIHLGHDRSARDVVDTAVEEDAHAVALTSYQGGHIEYFTYIRSLLDEAGFGHVHIYGGGGGTITPPEIRELQAAGIKRIYSPEDGRKMGLQGMIDDLVSGARSFDLLGPQALELLDGPITPAQPGAVARLITLAECLEEAADLSSWLDICRSRPAAERVPVVGLTGTGGAGKSSLLDELLLRIRRDAPDLRVALLCIDPTRKRTGGALLGDRIRMNSLAHPNVFMRSMASRGSGQEVSARLPQAIEALQATGHDLILVETSGIGQADDAIAAHADRTIYVMTPEFGAHTQLEKIEMLDTADLVVLNKFERRGAEDAFRAIRKQVQRNRGLFDQPLEAMPVHATIASQVADPGVDGLWQGLAAQLSSLTHLTRPEGGFSARPPTWPSGSDGMPIPRHVIPPDRTHHLSLISSAVRDYHSRSAEVAGQLRLAQHLSTAADHLAGQGRTTEADDLRTQATTIRAALPASVQTLLDDHRDLAEEYRSGTHTYRVRGRDLAVSTTTHSLAHTDIPRVALPTFADDGELLDFLRTENLPGHFPHTAGVFPFKRTDESPTRMFAGEGPSERTNRRFHLVSQGQSYARLSTAFDSVTLYGRDPDLRPDVHGKVGESGVAIFTVDEAKRLYSGFDLCEPNTSVSMTINGPAPIILAFFLNAAIDQQVERRLKETGRWDEVGARIAAIRGAEPAYHGDLPAGNDGFGLGTVGISGDMLLPPDEYEAIRASTLTTVRGTVQADILKEDQAQNTCIFSTEFALRMMGDVQQYYIDHEVRNHYSVSISGYHIAEAGANPITQLALTLANGFTYVEYYRSRGMDVNAFAPNLSFFFSNGMDPEYTVIGRVARRIWSIGLRDVYDGNDRAQKLKYHIQTSGRSLHAQEIDFNDIRTTLQALLAIQDNANSLHTNAFDEAITTPTPGSVRRALAIQMIVNQEFGWTKTENPLQGSFLVSWLTDVVEAAVLEEFDQITARGGVLGAMETQYQRSKIQEESLHYEELKHTGELPIVGVNTFRDTSDDSQSTDETADAFDMELARATPEEKQSCLDRLASFHQRHKDRTPEALRRLQEVARSGGNIFAELMETVKVASLGQISAALFKVGGQYRRNM